MMHSNRIWHIDVVDNAEKLAEAIKLSQTLCQGYLFHGVLWLNDSITSDPDRYWEYAVAIPYDPLLWTRAYHARTRVYQTDSVTIGMPWHNLLLDTYAEHLLDVSIRASVPYRNDMELLWVDVDFRDSHACEYCI